MEVTQTDKIDTGNSPEQVVSSEKEKNSEPESLPVKKSKEEKSRKKDDRSVEQILKSLTSLGTTEEKLTAICKKYSEILDENRKLQVQAKQYDKRLVGLQREKEQLQGEQSKAILTRSRLESLCRELQRQNKAIKEESLLRIREEEEKRKVVSAKFQSTLAEITTLMQQNNENNSKLRDENIEMQNKFKSVCEQYELREQQVEKISKQMQLESQLADAKLAKVKIEMVAEKEILANEKKQLLIELAACQNKCQELQKTEAALRGQISMYTEKYDEFQNALARSNQLYGGFKGEMEKMSKKITKLEKETTVWKMKWESSHKALLQMAAEKQQRDADLALSLRQLTQLQKLCRTLQAERTSLLAQLKNEGLAPKLTSIENSNDLIIAKESQECEFQSLNRLSSPTDDNVTLSNDENVDSSKSESRENKVPENVADKDEESRTEVNEKPQAEEEINTNNNCEIKNSDRESAESQTIESNSIDVKLSVSDVLTAKGENEESILKNDATMSKSEDSLPSAAAAVAVAEDKSKRSKAAKNHQAQMQNQSVPCLNGPTSAEHNLAKGDDANKSEPRKSKEGSKRRKK